MQRAFLEYDSAFLAAMAAAPKQVRRALRACGGPLFSGGLFRAAAVGRRSGPGDGGTAKLWWKRGRTRAAAPHASAVPEGERLREGEEGSGQADRTLPPSRRTDGRACGHRLGRGWMW